MPDNPPEFLGELSLRVRDEMVKQGVPQPKAMDPLTILFIVSALVSLGKTLYECWKNNHKGATEMVNNPTFLHRWLARRLIRAEFSRQDWKEHKDTVCQAFFKLGEIAHEDEVTRLMEESTKTPKDIPVKY